MKNEGQEGMGAAAKPLNEAWREITRGGDREEFRNITSLLVDYDERSRRHLRFGDPEVHYMRKAVVVAESWRVRVFLQRVEECVFYVVAEVESENGSVATAWLHEDGILRERSQLRGQPQHPVHRLTCLSDLYERATKLSEDFGTVLVNTATWELLSRSAGD